MSEEVLANSVYQHYKGAKYAVLFVADESTNARGGNKVVVYLSLTTGKVHTRDLAQFVEIVEWPDGVKRPRFIPAE